MDTKPTLSQLLAKPIWQMTGEEFLQLNELGKENAAAGEPKEVIEYAHGITELFQKIGCCQSTIYMLKKEGYWMRLSFRRSVARSSSTSAKPGSWPTSIKGRRGRAGVKTNNGGRYERNRTLYKGVRLSLHRTESVGNNGSHLFLHPHQMDSRDAKNTILYR